MEPITWSSDPITATTLLLDGSLIGLAIGIISTAIACAIAWTVVPRPRPPLRTARPPRPAHRLMSTITLERPIVVGDKIRFHDAGTADKRWWWDVQAVGDRYVIATHRAAFHPKADNIHAYTIIDWRDDVRGPSNLIGNGYDFGTDLREGAHRLLEELTLGTLELSHRRHVPLGRIELHP